ncbi:UNVERIFIED_CONTAM: hypothetical protein H355_000110 [Colinus virginianus]|nr:hypothetical protein H355_000110 [Colinus virginianus]
MILLLPELTFLTGIAEIRKDGRVLKDVMQEMLQSPQQHYEALHGLLRRMQRCHGARQELQQWGLRLGTDIQRDVMQEMLQSPQQHYEALHGLLRRMQRCHGARQELQQWGLRLGTDIQRVAVQCWLLVYPRRLQDVARSLVGTMRSACGPMGMQVSPPVLLELKDERLDSYTRAIRGALANEVINVQSLLGCSSKQRSVVQRVLLQINCKLGGELWGVDVPLLPQQEIADTLRLCMTAALQRYHEVRPRGPVGQIRGADPWG